MPTLDDDFGYIDPNTVKPFSTAARHGALASIVLVIIGLLMHLMGLNDYEAAAAGESNTLGTIVQFLNYAIWIGAIVMAIKTHRDIELGGYISFGRAFFTGFITSVVMGLISAVWAYLFFTLIAPEAIELMMEGALENMSEDQAEGAEEMMGMFMSPGFMAGSILLMTIVLGVIISLIASAVMKKEHPNSH